MTRGRKKGYQAPTPRAESLVAKLFHLGTGETIYFDDLDYPKGTATKMERSVYTHLARSHLLAGRVYTTERWAAVQTGPLRSQIILAVRRTK